MTDEISTEWTGHDLLDINGEKIGTVEDVRFGDATGGLKWLLVKTGLLGTKKVLVPAGEVRATEDALVVPFTKDKVKESPGVDEDEGFTPDEERSICSHYGLEYVSEFGAPEEGCADRAASGARDLSSPPAERTPPADRTSRV
jgi:sporulation protein YlmC with PRC-barrel domain